MRNLEVLLPKQQKKCGQVLLKRRERQVPKKQKPCMWEKGGIFLSFSFAPASPHLLSRSGLVEKEEKKRSCLRVKSNERKTISSPILFECCGINSLLSLRERKERLGAPPRKKNKQTIFFFFFLKIYHL
jgi:hypothetical protein